MNGRETGDDARLQIRSRREGSEEREADVRNGSSLAKERSRDHAYDGRRREREKERDSGRLSSHHDEENRRDHKDSHHQDKVRARASLPVKCYLLFHSHANWFPYHAGSRIRTWGCT